MHNKMTVASRTLTFGFNTQIWYARPLTSFWILLFRLLASKEEIEVRHGEDGFSSRNLAAASEKIISDSDVVNSLLDYLPLVEDGDVPSDEENEFDP
jgi:hypothetical protein